MRRIGNIASRTIVGGDRSNQIGDDIRKTQTMGQPPILQKAVVVDVITDPDLLEEAELDAIAESVSNAELVDVMPFNSIIGRIVSNNSGGTARANIILFPFFSSHLMMPVSPGETVYVIFEDYKETGSALGYWFTRTHAPKTVEDANYTHLDRRFDASMNPQNYSTEERSRINENGNRFAGPGFPNGGNTTESLTLEKDPDVDIIIDPYEQIKEESKSYSNVVVEPVPRWRKRPQEYVIQGSNNSLIFLGRDRGGAVDNPEDAQTQAGTVGIIAGRGRKTTFKTETGDEVPEDTAPRVIQNTRGEYETDKSPYRRNFNRRDNPREGNPDFINDASMLFVTMQSQIDKRFNLKLNQENSLTLPNIEGEGTFNRSHVVGKADHIRFVARKDTEKGVKGTILLIREGQQNEDLGYFFIDDTGKIQIESSKIYLGKSTNENEPYIKWTEYKNSVDALQSQIDALVVALKSALGNLGAPIPSLAAINVEAFKTAQKQAVEASKSSKIFGE